MNSNRRATNPAKCRFIPPPPLPIRSTNPFPPYRGDRPAFPTINNPSSFGFTVNVPTKRTPPPNPFIPPSFSNTFSTQVATRGRIPLPRQPVHDHLNSGNRNTDPFQPFSLPPAHPFHPLAVSNNSTKPVIPLTPVRRLISPGYSQFKARHTLMSSANPPATPIPLNVFQLPRNSTRPSATVFGGPRAVQIPNPGLELQNLATVLPDVSYPGTSTITTDELMEHEKLVEETSKNPPKENNIVVPQRAKIPLKVHTPAGKTYSILAYTDWTVRKLKQEFLRFPGQKDAGRLELQHIRTTTLMLKDDRFMGSYKLEPDSVIEANSDSPNHAAELPDNDGQQNNIGNCKQIANCVAAQNGTELAPVDGIKKGHLVIARTDLDNLTVGEVGATCSITGFDENIFVGVKFRKHLPLGSSGIQIEHVAGVDADCDKCKGRKYLFIPVDHIGPSKDYLFEVQ